MHLPSRLDVLRGARGGGLALTVAALCGLAAQAGAQVPPPPDVAAVAAVHVPAPAILLYHDAPGAYGTAALPPNHPVALAEYLELVRLNNPALQAERSRIDAARADLRTASTLPNPVLSYGRRPGEREAVVQQPLPIFGQRGLRMEGAQLGIAATTAGVAAIYADTLRDAARRFAALLVAQERRVRWQAAQADLARAARIVAGQVEAGARSRYDLARIDIQQAQVALQVAQADAAYDEAAAEVAAAAALPGWRPAAVGSLWPAPEAPPFDTLWPLAAERLPAVRAAAAEEALAQKRVEVERREALPTPTVGVGQLRHNDGRGLIVGVAVEIPLFDRRQGPIARAEAERTEAALRRQAVTAAAQAELRRATEQLAQRRRFTARFEQDALARLPGVRQMAEDAYQLGQGSVLELIDSIQSVAEKQIAYLELVEATLQAEIDVQAAAGVLPGEQL